MGRIWAVCSGSGGVGKTTLAIALAMGAAQRGKSAVILDASGPSRSCDLMMGLESVITLDMGDVLTQQIDIQSALYPVPRSENLRLCAASLYDGIPLSELSGVILAIQSMCDILVIDLPTGGLLTGNGIWADRDECLIVTRPDDLSIRSSERLMQQMKVQGLNVSLLINRSGKERIKQGQQYDSAAVSMILDAPVVGTLPEDDVFSIGVSQSKKPIDWARIARHHSIREILDRLVSD